MYQSGLGNSVPILAATGVSIAFYAIAGWTLILAGIALFTVSRIVWKRTHRA